MHIRWEVTRVRDSVQYRRLIFNRKSYTVDMTLDRQPRWGGSDIDTAVQLDGDDHQTGYNLWIDNVSLTAWY